MKKYLKYWILIVLILQPVIDIAAYFTYQKQTMLTLVLRSLISFFIVLYTFVKSNNKKKYILYMLPICIFVLFHLLNSYRIGIIDAFKEVRYIVSVFNMPILTIALIDYIKNRKEYINQIKWGILINLFIIFISVVISIITNTYNSTYEFIGITGWFYSPNTQSMVLTALSPLFMYYISKNNDNFIYVIAHLILFFLLFLNGTKACFFTLIVTYLVMLFVCIFDKETVYRKIRIIITSIFIAAVILFIDNSAMMMRKKDVLNNDNRIKNSIKNEYANIDLKTLPKETVINILNDFEYWSELIDYFGEDIIYDKMYNHLHIEEFSNNRLRKKIYGEILFEKSDFLTKLVGIEYSSYSSYPVVDMENDLTAIFYYYGYIGFALYAIYIMYFIYLIFKTFLKDKKVIFDGEFIFLAVTLFMLLFGSEYSGALLRKPNANIYMSVLLALIYFKCTTDNNIMKLNNKTKSNKKKITFLLLHLGFGGIETATINTANALSKKYDIELIIFYKLSKDQFSNLNKNVKVKYLCKYTPNRDEFKTAIKHFNLIKAFFEGFKSIKILYQKKHMMIKEIKESDSDYIVSTRIEYSTYLSKYGKKDCVKIAQEHRHHNNEKNYIYTIANKFNNIDYLFALTNSLKKDYEKFLVNNKHTKVVVVPNMTYMPKKKSKLKTNNIITISRLHPGKKIDDLIEIFSMLEDKKSKLYIVGDGSELVNLKELVNNKNLNDRVIFTGYKTKDEMEKYILDSKIFAMTSLTEGLPMVLLEAMGYGLPCIAFETESGVADIIDDGINGYIIKNRDKLKYVDILNRMLKDKDMVNKLSKNAIDKVEKFTEESVVSLWMDILK